MSALSRLVWRSVLASVVLASASLAAPGSHAQALVLTPEMIASYQSKVTRGREKKAALDGRAMCFAQYEGQLVVRRDENQVTLGSLRRQERQLESEVATSGDKAKLLADEADRESAQLKVNNDQLTRLSGEISDKKNEMARCRLIESMLPFPSMACNLTQLIELLSGRAASLRNAIADSERRVKQSAQYVEDLKLKVSQANAELSVVVSKKSTLSSSIIGLEKDIATASKVLSDLRFQSQSNNELVDLLQGILQDAASIDTEDGLKRTALAAIGIAENLDRALSRSQDLIAASNAALPPDVADRCTTP